MEKNIKVFEGVYKTSTFAKSQRIDLICLNDHIEGKGLCKVADYIDKKVSFFSIIYSVIKKVQLTSFNNTDCIEITYKDTFSISTEYKDKILLLPGIKNSNTALNLILDIKKSTEELLRKNSEIKAKKDEKEKLQYEESEKFYRECYDFHITEKQRPLFTVYKEDLIFAGVYVNEDDGLNFLYIDGRNKVENIGTIPLDKIHYYDKAGSKHYVEKIQGKYSSVGGSFTGGSFSKKAVTSAGWLFGVMGIAMGLAYTYQPAEYVAPDTEISISSHTQLIDDRSIILNFYSNIKKQYVEMELPADIYNFFETYFPQKKYEIVLSKEKKMYS